MSNNAHDLSNRLLNALDTNYNVVDMRAVNEIISILEKLNITKELLETTRLGKHVNELRRKTTDPTLARRAKVLVKRWRDLVIPSRVSPAHTGSSRSSAERQMRRLGGTPLTSPALSRQVVSPAIVSPRPPSRPAWGGYESDSQDVILVDDDPPPPAAPSPAPAAAIANATASQKPNATPVKRQPSPEAALHDEKKAKRDKKPKKRRGHSRAGTGTETTTPAPTNPSPLSPATPIPSSPARGPAPAPPTSAHAHWGARNGAAHAHTERRRNGCRRDAVDPYTALVNKIPAAGAKKVKTTKELLEQIQSRGSKPLPSPGSPDADDDVVVIEDVPPPIKVDSPLRNGGSTPPRPPSPPPRPQLEDERQYFECTCTDDAPDSACLARREACVRPWHVLALHHAFLPGVNGTRAPTHPHQYAVRPPSDPETGLFTSVVPLYKYSDYADDYCVKNMFRVPICEHLPWTEFAPPPPDPPPPPSPPPLRPYPIDDIETTEVKMEVEETETEDKPEVKKEYNCHIAAETPSVPSLEPSERLKAPLLTNEEVKNFGNSVPPVAIEVVESVKSEEEDHRTVERTKEELDGRGLYALCEKALESVPYSYGQTDSAPIVTLPENVDEGEKVLLGALESMESERTVDELGRPPRPTNFTEWHECAKLGDLIALPYVVID